MYACAILYACFSLPLLFAQSIGDFNSWEILEDPPHSAFSISVNNASVTLSAADSTIPHATDIGIISSGFAFQPDKSFSLAIDYQFSFSSSSYSGLAIGFGIGEDSNGMNSAGVSIIGDSSFLYSPALAGAAARTNDVNTTPALLNTAVSLTGSMQVAYSANTGNIKVGYGLFSQDHSIASHSFTAIQNGWGNKILKPSLFLRSDKTLGNAWNGGGIAQAKFSNFRVLSGSPTNVPEPSATILLGLGCFRLLIHRKR